jgi:hypothetical protein
MNQQPLKGDLRVSKQVVSLLLLLISSTFWGQDRFLSGEFKGFTKSRGEHIINRLEQPFFAQRIDGTVMRSVGDKLPMENVLIEFRGLGRSENMRSAKTDANGRFDLANVPTGKYLFKATALGFQSIVGVVIVSPKGARDQAIILQMSPGV